MMSSSKPITMVITRDEVRALSRRSDLAGLRAVASTWLLIALAFVFASWHWVGVLLAVVLLGGRQLSLAVLMHEASHRTLFHSRWLNEVLGRWLLGAPVGFDLARYRRHHWLHHHHTGTEQDPDLGLVTPYPVSAGSLARKLARDLTGIAGLRRVVALVAMDLGLLEFAAGTGTGWTPPEQRRFSQVIARLPRLLPPLITNGALFGVLGLVGRPDLYLVWVAAYLTTFSLFFRLRSIAEHACTTPGADPWTNTRSMHAGFLARLLVAPHNVGLHLEHHVAPSVPYHRLPEVNRMLAARGALARSHIGTSYLRLLRTVTRAG